jgi:hypothetical protein
MTTNQESRRAIESLNEDAETSAVPQFVTPVLSEESPQAAWERLSLQDAWEHGYADVRGFAG